MGYFVGWLTGRFQSGGEMAGRLVCTESKFNLGVGSVVLEGT